MKTFLPKIVPLVLSLSALLLLASCMSNQRHEKKRFFRMDTVTEITIVSQKKLRVNQLWCEIDSLLKDWEERFSITHERSEVRKLNERTGEVVVVGPLLLEMLQTAQRYSDTLDGHFDITILPVKELWGFGETESFDSTVPNPEMISKALEAVDHKKVNIEGNRVHFLSPDTRIDVGGVAKGFVLREIARVLEKKKIINYLVVAGGDIVASGKRSDGRPWKIGIQHPRDRDAVAGSVDIDTGSIVTSGDYERFRIVNGIRYHHLFDPRTGYSSSENQSVTIYGKDPVEVDILSTGLFLRSAASIVDYVNSRPQLEALVIDSSGTPHFSDGWKGTVTRNQD